VYNVWAGYATHGRDVRRSGGHHFGAATDLPAELTRTMLFAFGHESWEWWA
jgi:hypothetical protein